MRTLLHSASLVAILALAACDDFAATEDFHFSYPLNAGAAVEIENSNGSVEISGWDRNTVEIEGEKYASSEQRLKEIQIDITHSPGAIHIRTVLPVNRFGSYGARYVLHVPRHADLAHITSSNGAVRVDGIEGPAVLRTSNGGIRVSAMQGSLDAWTSNGMIEISDVSGDTALRTSNGNIQAGLKTGSFEAHTSNGNITARLTGSDARPVRLSSSNGHIDLTMDAVHEVHAQTSNSPIVVYLPGGAGATVRAHTSNAAITHDFSVTVHGLISKHRLEGAIGPGGPLLDLTTSNGPIRISRL